MSVRDQPWLHVFWCDDIRQELGNKPSLMGVYTGGLIVEQLPVLLPRLCAFVTGGFPENEMPRKLTVLIKRSDGLLLGRTDIDRGEEAAPPSLFAPDELDLPKMTGFHFAAIMGNLELTAETTSLRVYLEADGLSIPSYRLPVRAKAPVV